MIASPSRTRILLDELCEHIASALGAAQVHELPALSEGLGLAPGTEQEALLSKRLYVKNRIQDLREPALMSLAEAVLEKFSNPSLAALVSEMTAHAMHRVSEITRRNALKALNGVEQLFGQTDLFARLGFIEMQQRRDPTAGHSLDLVTLAGQIRRHQQRNDGWSHEWILIECGALACSQARFFQLLEMLLNPIVRQGEEQSRLASTLGRILGSDGFRLVVTGEQSRHPIYRVARIPAGVSGTRKNLIFAATSAKPDLYFVDAINNDIGIRNDSDALIYDEFLSESGMLWRTLVQWWQTRQGLDNRGDAQRSLYCRLRQAVRATHSVVQHAVFDTYYREFPPRMGDSLPALIPEVYLHYDPRTLRERGADSVLRRQRMDFVLLLNHRVRVVIEIDGSQHYSEAGRPAPTKYAEMVEKDRQLRLDGYELYRFGAAELPDATAFGGKITVGPHSRAVVVEFFNQLWRKHELKLITP